MNKRGQFYLVAAIVIVALIAGIFTVTNYSKQDESTRVYDLSEELGVEGDQVLDYGLVLQSSSSSSDTKTVQEVFTNFTSRYSKYVSDSNINIYFIFGNRTSISVVSYNELSGSFSLGESSIPISGGTSKQTYIPKEDKITVKINNSLNTDETEYTFNLQPGENFYYIISQENADGTKEVATSK